MSLFAGPGGNIGVMSTPVELDQNQVDETGTEDRPWLTIVWNDPVNLMYYVTYVFQRLFGYSQDQATKLMLDVHNKGRAVVTRVSPNWYWDWASPTR